MLSIVIPVILFLLSYLAPLVLCCDLALRALQQSVLHLNRVGHLLWYGAIPPITIFEV